MKKALIITYYWPPAGGSGVQRWLYFTKYLKEFGIEPVIYAPSNPSYPLKDASLKAEIPEDLTVIKRPIREPNQVLSPILKKETKNLSSGIIDEPKNQSALQKALLYVRGNFFIPDARVLWVKPSVKYLTKFLEREQIHTVITTGPPQSTHLIGLGLKKQLDLKWIADFRDPWTESSNHHQFRLSKKAQKKHKDLERQVLTGADHLLTTSFQTKRDFERITSKPVHSILNGYDTTNDQKVDLDKEFTISHIGILLADRNPVNLWKALAELTKENEAFRKHFKLQLIGKTSDKVLALLDELSLTEFVKNYGYVSHQRALDYQMRSQLLLLLQMDGEKIKGIIPGKLFEYLNSKRPVVAFGPKNWDVQKILENTNGGTCFTYTDKDAVKKQIRQYFEAYQKQDLSVNSKNLKQYHRRELTKKLVDII